MAGKAGERRRHRVRGSETLEFGLVLIPMLGFVFLTIDLGWAVFAKSTLQHAVREGVRFGVTNNLLPGDSSMRDSIKKVVQYNAMGMLEGDAGLSRIQVKYKEPVGFTDITGSAGCNNSPNLLEVTVENFSLVPLLPLLRSATPMVLRAISSDRVEACVPTGCPPA
jgi:Flp pilus assembly protein TadG